MTHNHSIRPPDAGRPARGSFKPSRLLLLAILLAALLMTATTVLAAVIPVQNVDGVFGAYTPLNINCVETSNTPGDTTNLNYLRYGQPASAGGACGLVTQRSGYGFDGRNGTFNIDSDAVTPTFLGTLTHYNNPIFAPAMTSAQLTVNVRIGGIDYAFPYTIQLDETPNNTRPCPYPAGTSPGDAAYEALNGGFSGGDGYQCGDRTLLQSTPTSVVIPYNGEYFVLDISGFTSAGANNTCEQADYANGISTVYLTREQTSQPACLFGKLTYPTTTVLVNKTGPTTAVPGSTIQYPITYQNTGLFNLTNVFIEDVLPPNMKLSSYTIVPNPTGAVCTDSPVGAYGATVTCGASPNYLHNDANLLAPGASGRTITLSVLVNPDDLANVERTNTACVKGQLRLPNIPWTSPNIQSSCDDAKTTTPVTVAYFSATETAGGVRFDWSTATETANGGFNLYARTAGGVVKLNDTLILSKVMDSSGPTDYSVMLADVPTGEYYIEDVSLFGQVRAHAAIELNGSFGEKLQPEEIDWPAINAENAALEQQRLAAASALAATPEAVAATYPTLDLRVREDGIYRLTYEQIKAAGVDLAGVPKSNLAITLRGLPVASYVSKFVFGPGAYIEFVGKGLDTIYTDTNVYRLEVNKALARRTAISRLLPPRPAAAYAGYYMETATVENNRAYSYLSPNGDPWYDMFLNVAPGGPASADFTVNVSDYVAGAPAMVTFDLWGASEIISGPDHHARVAVNGTQVADEWFDGTGVKVITAPLPAGVLANGANTLRLTAPADQVVDVPDFVDTFVVESYGITYPRAFKAIGGRLDFEAKARGFRVSNLDSNQVVAYRVIGNQTTRLHNVKVAADGAGYIARFAGGRNAAYYVSTVASLLTPEIAVTPARTDITGGTADLLIIAHPNFMNADLDRLVQARQAQGYAVKVVDVTQVFAQFSGGIFDPQAIRDYARHAIYEMGVEYFLLVGADTRDYFNYGGLGSISFIPSLYANTLDPVKLAPVDPLYTDYNADNVPDRAIGRFPVRTVAELKMMVDKTLQYDARAHVQTAVFVADEGFEFDSEAFAAPLAGWTVDKAYVRQMGVPSARTLLIDALNTGPRLASFVGHSGPTNWKNSSLFRASDAAALTNVDAPTLVTQWGCWNTYYVDPRYDTLGHRFLLSGTNGAALVTGSSTLTNSDSERALGELLMDRLMQPGMTVGEAMRAAKVELAHSRPDMTDVLLGWTILGDPTIVVRP